MQCKHDRVHGSENIWQRMPTVPGGPLNVAAVHGPLPMFQEILAPGEELLNWRNARCV